MVHYLIVDYKDVPVPLQLPKSEPRNVVDELVNAVITNWMSEGGKPNEGSRYGWENLDYLGAPLMEKVVAKLGGKIVWAHVMPKTQDVEDALNKIVQDGNTNGSLDPKALTAILNEH